MTVIEKQMPMGNIRKKYITKFSQRSVNINLVHLLFYLRTLRLVMKLLSELP